jgi:hypothetical protein
VRPLRYSINVTLDGCCDHRVMGADEDLHRHAVENLDQADALLFGRVRTRNRNMGRASRAQRGHFVSDGRASNDAADGRVSVRVVASARN